MGNYATLIGESDGIIQLTTWNVGKWDGKLKIGDYALISPGVRILSAKRITIGNSCMFGRGAYVTDSDWHGVYDRNEVAGSPKEVILEDNVWIGDSAIICKGVRIGKNSIIGAGSVVTKNVEPNSIYAGNPAKFIKKLDEQEIIPRKNFYSNPKKLKDDFEILDKLALKDNTLFGWVKSFFFRNKDH